MVDSQSIQVARIVTDLLEALDVPYVVGGSFASAAHGQLRTTQDIDIIADIRLENAAALSDALGESFYVPDAVTLADAIERRRSFNLIHLNTMFKVDIFPTGDRPFDGQQIQRRVLGSLDEHSDQRVWLLSPEDIILAKLDWFRQGGEVAERQWRDVLDVMRTQEAVLDWDYLREWAGELSVLDLLELAAAAVSDNS